MSTLETCLKKAFQWLELENGVGFLSSQEHCPNTILFQTRLEHMLKEMGNSSFDFPLVGLIAGEIGNNAFDHNLGSWKDEKGIYFTYNLPEKFILIADRGQGLLSTLKHVRPELKTEQEAIQLAFTEKISGRFPEKRGKGLKLVRQVVQEKNWKLYFYSGNGMLILNKELLRGKECQNFKGVLAVLKFI